MKILVTGSSGFIGGYLVEELLKKGHFVIGVDNFSKYGKLRKNYDTDKNYKFVEADVKNTKKIKLLLEDCDHFVACAAKIGGIGYFHKFPYDIISENERITASSFDAAIYAFKKFKLKKITVLSSSMVFESVNQFPTPENAVNRFPAPKSAYGFQKLSTEYFAKAAFDQYKLLYTIIRPFNCVGIGETKAKTGDEILSGNIRLAMSHVVPDLAQKILKGQNPLHILGSGKQIRHFTYGKDIARGIMLAMFSKNAINEDFNISTEKSTTILELAEMIWKKVKPGIPLKIINDKPYENDVEKRIPDTKKAKKLLNFEANTSLDDVLSEIIQWVRKEINLGKL